MKLNKKYFFVLLLIFILEGCFSNSYKKYSDRSYSMGTFLEITFFSDKKNSKEILKECYKLADKLEKEVSCKIDNSIISKLNKEKTLEIKDNFVYDLLIESIKYGKETNGSFDPSLYHLIDLWGFESGKNRVPDEKEIKDVLSKNGFKNIVIKGKTIELKNNISLDLGGIAKGKIIGEIAEYLKQNGITDYLINGGGDIAIGGKYDRKRSWKVAITDPFDKDTFLGIIELSECSIVTSGDYERNFIGNDNKLYHHILDPKTGYPADNGIHSVTLITDAPAKADALATALFVMGADEGMKFVNSGDNIAAIFVTGTNDNKIIITSKNISKIKRKDSIWDFKILNNDLK